MKSTPGAIETCLFWQRHVLANSRDPKQIERAKAAIERLQLELDRLIKDETK